MNFYFEKTNNYLLNTTEVSNIFIKLYMPTMEPCYVKVYLYALMHIDKGIDVALSNESLAKDLNMSVAEVKEAWAYLDKVNLIRIDNKEKSLTAGSSITFLDLKARTFDPENIQEERDFVLDEKEVRDMYARIEGVLARPLTTSELRLVESFLDFYKIEPAAIAFLYENNKNKKASTKTRYIEKILMSYADQGLRTLEEIEEYNKQFDKREMSYREIMDALGLKFEIITDAERKEFSRWLDDFGLSLSDIIDKAELAAGKRNKYNYVKKIIEKEMNGTQDGQASQGGVGATASTGKKSLTTRRQYYEQTRKESEAAAAARKAEVYAKLPQIEALDKEIRELRMEVSIARSKGSGNATTDSLSSDLLDRENEKDAVLENAGYQKDYMEIKYKCEACSDTGILDNGASCSCY
jgi:DNA replication protein DnaD